MRAYGQKDPLNEYKQEAFLMFENMMKQIRQNVTKIISFVEIKTDVPENESQSIENKDNECLENLGLKKYLEMQDVHVQEKNIKIVAVRLPTN